MWFTELPDGVKPIVHALADLWEASEKISRAKEASLTRNRWTVGEIRLAEQGIWDALATLEVLR